jgi:RNA polymerase sigma-70 factor (ECF subfamily)
MSFDSETVEEVFRTQYGGIIATLIRFAGSFDLAEESLQEAFVTAVERWRVDGPPRNPGAWLTTVAHRKLLDALRREKTKNDKQPELEYLAESLQSGQASNRLEDEVTYPDDRLRLIFTCCHPSLSRDAQVALTLRTLGGLTTTEIARAFLVPEPTLAQRLVRAKNKIQMARIPYEVPSIESLDERLAAVQAAIYLIFNEGYSATTGDSLTRKELCGEAIRLGRVLCGLMPDEPENLGLLALMLLQDSRREARIDSHGRLATLDEQDRSLWDQGEIEEGVRLVESALHLGRVGPYQLQSAIAAVHAEARSADETDWPQIVALYRELMAISSSPIIALNYAAAVAMGEGLEKGLALIEHAGASGQLENYYLFHASRADLLRRMGSLKEARDAYSRALSLTTNDIERDFIDARLKEIRHTDQLSSRQKS